MKFSLVSDMHVNHPQPKTPYDQLEELVVVAGDTSNGLDGVKFLQNLQRKGFSVFAVDGNHEHYSNDTKGRTVAETTEQFYNLVGIHQVRDIGDVRLIGCNGWYYVDDEREWLGWMNDGRYAGNAREVNTQAEADIAFVREALSTLNGMKAVVVTHTAPCLETLNPEYEGHFSNDWYYNPGMGELMTEFRDSILVWCHGHTHAPADTIVNGVRVVCNPRGYPGENPSWKPMTVEV